jgi:hypothetical protein
MNIFASNFYTAYMEIPRYRIYKRKSPWPTITLLKKSKDRLVLTVQGYGSPTFLFMNIFASNFYTAYMEIPRYRIYKRKSPWPTITLLKKSKDYTPQETRSMECASLKMYMIFHLLLIKRGARSWWNGSTFLRCKIFWIFNSEPPSRHNTFYIFA